jgi:hypothetical protein
MPPGSGSYAVIKTPEKIVSIKTTKNAGQMAGVLIPVHNKWGQFTQFNLSDSTLVYFSCDP